MLRGKCKRLLLRYRRHFLPFVIVVIMFIGFVILIISSNYDKTAANVSDSETRLALRDSNFIQEIRSIFTTHFELYQKHCDGSDLFRPLSLTCRNITGLREMDLAALASYHFLRIPHPKPRLFDGVPELSNFIGIEIGHIAEHVIAPLISAFHVSGDTLYLTKSVDLGKQLLHLCRNKIPAPFIGYKQNSFNSPSVFLESISSIYPIFASLYVLTHDESFLEATRVFLEHMRRVPPQDLPLKSYADLARIGRMLPLSHVWDVFNPMYKLISVENPLLVSNQSQVFVYSIDTCTIGAYISSKHPLFNHISTKCENMIKRRPLPKRQYGSSEFGKYELVSSFSFEGELMDVLWRSNSTDLIPYIRNGFTVSRFNDTITGIRNVTEHRFRSDDLMHHQFYSRWILGSALIESNVPFHNVVLSSNGHILHLT